MAKSDAATLTTEFIGTYLLVLTVGCNVLTGSGTFAALSIASVLMVAIYMGASISGANYNPAVSFALFLAGKMDVATMGKYMATQMIAGLAAGFTYKTVLHDSVNLGPVGSYSLGAAAVAEILYTFMLCFTVLRTAVFNAKNETFGLCIGFVIVAGGYGAGAISGGAFNPAVAFGLDSSSFEKGFINCVYYTVFELIGAALAVAVNSIFTGSASEGVKKFTSEFLGTFFLVVTVGFNVINGSPAGALSIAASLMVMIYNLGGVSGAHFNPAVTFALALKNKDWKEVPLFMGAQILGGIAAGLVYTLTCGEAFPLGPGKGYSWADATFAEIVYTFVLCFTVLNVAGSTGGKSEHFYGLAIGFCVVVGGFAIGAISGGSLNPAVSIGIDTANAVKGGTFKSSLAYTGMELAGGALAYAAFAATRAGELKKA